MKTILVATFNKGKAAEIREIFAGSNYELKFLSDLTSEEEFKIMENAKSFEGNALIKAIVSGERFKYLTLADDSGFCVDHLEGRPGVLSARYAKSHDDAANNAQVLSEMEGVPSHERGCHYECDVAIYDPETGFVETTRGLWEGRLAEASRGDKSFGYAPVFLPAEFGYESTGAEHDHDKLVSINHRGKAFRQAKLILDEYLSKK